ncbi:triose-phosphate isomerase [Candidatus Uhrbacteria bacterium RIFCSPHIGHO2_12_FULL_57_11]|uniref:Triosephosphate isomerase n=2 Tax=Candidatus Uhriibacteriota TaxID=1752732 RepID=A0A1F7UMY8_9BACT|nr:MAG: triose-phosphate isomerase [Candidatus Uhrbacteria bacterium RIFCSPHIGHO2_02_FULL_57_19]OGL79605.1 MAG: triose-phosphate isomerase [Candidatus Uhrbacteria bacterium RIFCSPHIGHO2_12_FULL_57_11]
MKNPGRNLIKRYVIANWKMQLSVAESETLALDELASCGEMNEGLEVVICPSFTALERVGKAVKGSLCALGAQDLFWEAKGQYTGEVSAATLKELGAKYVIVGHSERRQHLGETDLMINKKVLQAVKSGLVPIVCVGETKEERRTGKRDAVVERQVRAALQGVKLVGSQELLIAYEPVWVIGTGQAVDPEDAARSHMVIRETLRDLFPEPVAQRAHIIYGGSVDSKNIDGFVRFPEIEGVLVGGASLKPREFLRIASVTWQAVIKHNISKR